MLFDCKFEITYTPEDLTVGRKILRDLSEFPPGVWTSVSDALERLMRQRATKITRYNVNKKTQQWRKSMNKNGRSVPTYNGSEDKVLNNPRVGRRTATFINDLRNSKEPTVEKDLGGFFKGRGGTSGVAIKNGMFSYSIDIDVFDSSYPGFFASYLERRGIIPEGGLLDFEESGEEYLLDILFNEVDKRIESLYGRG